jgi:hypothetical protein
MASKYLANVGGFPTEVESRDVSAGAADAGVIVALNSNGVIDSSMLANDHVPATSGNAAISVVSQAVSLALSSGVGNSLSVRTDGLFCPSAQVLEVPFQAQSDVNASVTGVNLSFAPGSVQGNLAATVTASQITLTQPGWYLLAAQIQTFSTNSNTSQSFIFTGLDKTVWLPNFISNSNGHQEASGTALHLLGVDTPVSFGASMARLAKASAAAPAVTFLRGVGDSVVSSLYIVRFTNGV